MVRALARRTSLEKLSTGCAYATDFIYVSVAHPAPVMSDYIAARLEAEALLRDSGMKVTILQPWYVLGRAAAGRWCCCRFTGSRLCCRRRVPPRAGWASSRSRK